MINKITADDVRQMIGSEGLVLQGCGGDPAEWLQGINEMLTEDGILLNGAAFKDISVFEYNGLTNILFPFGSLDSDTLHIGKLAIWRLKTHSAFGGTWLSDYLPNSLGVDITAAKESVVSIIRAAKASAKSAPEQKPHEKERGGHKISFEPEV